MPNNKDLKNMLRDIEKFYQPEHPELKDGIGHEVEHIKGVIRRTEEITNIVKDNTNEKPRMDLSITVAALHDIGNVINRDFHGHLGLGILKGELSFNDILDVPIKFKYDSNKVFATEKDIKVVKDYLNNNLNYKSTKELNKRQRALFLECIKIKSAFDIGYNGINPEKVKKYLKNEFGLSPKSIDRVTSKILKNNKETGKLEYKGINYEKSKELKELTSKIHQIYPSGSEELDIIAKAVQDHNIDFCINKQNEKERYEARNLYGMIVADADKDNVPETFAVRTLAYALNKWWSVDHNPYFSKPILMIPDMDKCMTHVLHQANERFRQQFEPHKGLFGKMNKQMNIHDDVFLYKHISDIKGASEVKAEEIEQYKTKGYTVFTVPEANKAGVPLLDSGKHYIFTMAAGDDIYSQIDKHFEIDKVLHLRDDFLKTMSNWADPSKEKANMKTMMQIKDVFINSLSIEEAVDKYETTYWTKETGHNINENSFGSIVEGIFPNETDKIDISEKYVSIREDKEIQDCVSKIEALQEKEENNATIDADNTKEEVRTSELNASEIDESEENISI